MYVADMYIKVTQYDKIQRAVVGDSLYYSVLLYDDVLLKKRVYVTFCCLHGKTIRTKCNLKVAFSWIYKAIGSSNMVAIWALIQIYFGSVQSTV